MKMERAMGFEPTTACLGSKNSTAELRPLGRASILRGICDSHKIAERRARSDGMRERAKVRDPSRLARFRRPARI